MVDLQNALMSLKLLADRQYKREGQEYCQCQHCESGDGDMHACISLQHHLSRTDSLSTRTRSVNTAFNSHSKTTEAAQHTVNHLHRINSALMSS